MKRSILIRLDDACESMDTARWQRMQTLLTSYGVKPLVGIIPHCEDETLLAYGVDINFWERVEEWKALGWTFALHGYNHVYTTKSGGIHPVNDRSEFAGVALEEQRFKIREGMAVLKAHGICPNLFFAPSHTFDRNTLEAIKSESNIKIISDGIANDIYFEEGLYFIPQQVGRPVTLPLKFVTVCLHPNVMNDGDFEKLEAFLAKKSNQIVSVQDVILKERRPSLYDKFLRRMYFMLRSIKKKI